MSTSRLRFMNQKFLISSTSWNNGVLTVNTVDPHFLFDGVEVIVASSAITAIDYQGKSYPVTVTGERSFTVNADSDFGVGNYPYYVTRCFLPGQTGAQEKQSLPRSNGYPIVVQSYVNGVGGAEYSIEASLNGEHWIQMATVSHDTSDGDTAFITVHPGWNYIRVSLSLVGSDTALVVFIGD